MPPGGIRNHNPSKGAEADPRPHDRAATEFGHIYVNTWT